MKNPQIKSSFALGLAVSLGSLAAAQDRQPVSSITGQAPQGESRFEVGLAFAQSLGSSTFNGTQSIRDYAEDGSLRSAYEVGKAPGGGFDIQYNLGSKFGLRLGAQTFSRKSTGTFDASVPHPFFFSRPRTVTGTVEKLGFSESAFSLTAVYRGGSGKWKLNLEGGPAYFNVNATVAERITLGEVYPYDTVTFGGIASTKKKVSPIGFAVGLEIGRELSNAVSVVAQGRFTQGSGDIDVNGQSLNVKAGGAQARIGLRIVLARKRVGS
jgi:hypothetical protein